MKKIMLFFSLSLYLIFNLTSCSLLPSKPAKERNAKPLILVSVAPYEHLVRQIAGDTVRIKIVVPPDVDPHNWEPPPREVIALQEASIWLAAGESFEPPLEKKLREVDKNIAIYNLTTYAYEHAQSLPATSCCPHGHHEDHPAHSTQDTHIWLNPHLDAIEASYIRDILIELSPEHRPFYEANCAALITTLTQLDREFKEKLAPYHDYVIVTTHAAYAHFTDRYGLIQIAIEPSGGREARTKDIAHIMQELQSHEGHIIAVFLQPQHVNKAAQTIADKMHLPTFMVNPYAENYIETMKEMTEIITAHGKK